MRDHHAQQLRDNRRCDVGHDAQGKNGELQKSATTKEVDQFIQTRSIARSSQTLLNVAVVHKGGGDERAQAKETDDEKCETNLSTQIRSPEYSP